MKKICIQAGHINSSQSSLGLGSGAPGEQELTKRIGDRLSSLMREKGFEVVQTDANANDDPNITSKDWDLFLALHGDADYAGDNGSGFATFPEPSTDGATAESQRIAKVINETYFPEVKIVYRDLSNANTKYYYMWKYLTAKTPCVLIEMGQVQDPHDKVLLANTDLICNALGRSICKAFGVPFDNPPPSTPSPDYKTLYEVLASNAMGVAVSLGLDKNASSDEVLMAIKALQDRIKQLEGSISNPSGTLPENLTVGEGKWGLNGVEYQEGVLRGTYKRL